MDEYLNKLEELAILGDKNAQVKLVQGLFLAGDLPEELAIFINLVDLSLRYSYYAIVKFLTDEGIPFEFCPESRCNCENMACADIGDHPMLKNLEFASRCEKCDWPLDLDKSCINRECVMFRKPQYTVGPCSRTAWRTYEDLLGGYCDTCSGRLPLNYHSKICNCSICGTGVGPYILLRAQFIAPSTLAALANNYYDIFLDRRTITQPFTEALNISANEEEKMRRNAETYHYQYRTTVELYQEPREARYLNSFGTCLIEIRPNGSYRLRMMEHLNEKAIQIPTFKRDMDFCQLIGSEPDFSSKGSRKRRRSPIRFTRPYIPEYHQTFVNACNLLKLHYLGRDFSLEGMKNHLSSEFNRAPDARKLVHQIQEVLYASPLSGLNYYLVIDDIDNVDRNAIDFTLPAFLNIYRGPNTRQNAPIAINVTRRATYDQVDFYVPDNEMSIYPGLILNSSNPNPRGVVPEEILQRIYEAVVGR